MGEVFWRYTDSAGNYHLCDTESGHRMIPAQPKGDQMIDNTQQTRALINELKELNRNMGKLITILGCTERNTREIANGFSKDEQKTVEEETEE